MIKHDNNIFCEYTIKSWEDCRRLFKYLANWVFRGQSNSAWPLETTLERGAIINNSDIRNIPEIERRIIQNFKRRAFNYLDELPEKSNLLEWLSLMQHHGAPTRLLDFSYSYYVALYFSIEQALQESAVFCLNKNLIYNEGLKTEKWRGLEDDCSFGTSEYCNCILNEQIRSPLVMLVEPYKLHERLSKQQGVFAIPFEGRQSFEYNLSLTINKFQKELPISNKIEKYDNLLCILNQECVLLKVKIPKEFHNEITKDLKLMNITSETLFPGIDGFAKSLYSEFDL